MKKRTRLIAGTLLCSFLLGFEVGCVKKDYVDESESPDSEVESEISETEEPETSEESEEIYEAVGEGLTESELYDIYRDIAKQIYINDGKDYLYGFGKEYLNGYVCENSEYALFIFDDNDNLIEYKYQDENIIKYTPSEMYDVEHLLTYDQFLHLPCLLDQPMIETYNSVIGDGKYTGTVIGFSADMDYAIALVGQIYAFTLSKDQCLLLKKGDHIEVDGDAHDYVVVTDVDDYGEEIRIEVDDYCWFMFDKDDEEYEREYVLTKFEHPYYTDSYSFVMIPISQDCEFDLYIVHGDVDGCSLICSENAIGTADAKEIIVENSDIVNDSEEMIIRSYENGGYETIGSIVKPLEIKDGVATYISFIRCA